MLQLPLASTTPLYSMPFREMITCWPGSTFVLLPRTVIGCSCSAAVTMPSPAKVLLSMVSTGCTSDAVATFRSTTWLL